MADYYKGVRLTSDRIKFMKKYNEFDDNDLAREILYMQQKQNEKLEKIRSNTSKLVWWLIAIPILFVVGMFLLGALKI